jgi:hypothetical protein
VQPKWTIVPLLPAEFDLEKPACSPAGEALPGNDRGFAAFLADRRHSLPIRHDESAAVGGFDERRLRVLANGEYVRINLP